MENNLVENIKRDMEYLSKDITLEDSIKTRLQANLKMYLEDINYTYQVLSGEKSSKALINKLIK